MASIGERSKARVRKLYPYANWGNFWKGAAAAADMTGGFRDMWLEDAKNTARLLPTAWYVEPRPAEEHPKLRVVVMIQAITTAFERDADNKLAGYAELADCVDYWWEPEHDIHLELHIVGPHGGVVVYSDAQLLAIDFQNMLAAACKEKTA